MRITRTAGGYVFFDVWKSGREDGLRLYRDWVDAVSRSFRRRGLFEALIVSATVDRLLALSRCLVVTCMPMLPAPLAWTFAVAADFIHTAWLASLCDPTSIGLTFPRILRSIAHVDSVMVPRERIPRPKHSPYQQAERLKTAWVSQTYTRANDCLHSEQVNGFSLVCVRRCR